MMNWPVPSGLDKALEEEKDEEMEDVKDEPLEGDEEWRPGMKLTASHPSWMWKQNRKDLASREGRNKAGKKRGAGTTSQIRAARKDYWGSETQQDSNPSQRDEDLWSHPWEWSEADLGKGKHGLSLTLGKGKGPGAVA